MPICTLPGGRDCENFLRITVQIELEALPGLKVMQGSYGTVKTLNVLEFYLQNSMR